MAKNYTFVLSFFVCALITVISAQQKTNCKGKGFVCVDSKRFRMCIEVKEGVTETVDHVIYTCVLDSICDDRNDIECALVGPMATVPSGVQTTISPNELPKCPRIADAPDPKDCHAYYVCQLFWNVRKVCPNNTVFDKDLATCDPKKTKC